MNVKRIRELQNVLRENSEDFDMNSFIKENCGTPACIGGWAAAMAIAEEQKNEVPLKDTLNVAFNDFYDKELLPFSQTAKTFLEIDSRVATNLFYPWFADPEWGGGKNLSVDPLTSDEAIETLNILIDTGEVIWPERLEFKN